MKYTLKNYSLACLCIAAFVGAQPQAMRPGETDEASDRKKPLVIVRAAADEQGDRVVGAIKDELDTHEGGENQAPSSVKRAATTGTKRTEVATGGGRALMTLLTAEEQAELIDQSTKLRALVQKARQSSLEFKAENRRLKKRVADEELRSATSHYTTRTDATVSGDVVQKLMGRLKSVASELEKRDTLIAENNQLHTKLLKQISEKEAEVEQERSNVLRVAATLKEQGDSFEKAVREFGETLGARKNGVFGNLTATCDALASQTCAIQKARSQQTVAFRAMLTREQALALVHKFYHEEEEQEACAAKKAK